MIRKRLGRFATILTTASLATMLLGVGSATAANPSWHVSFDRLPNVVSPGSDAGWFVTVSNSGPSNINDLNISITSEEAGALPSYISDLVLSSGGTEDCDTATGALVCNVGTLVAGGTVTFTVAFHVPSTDTGIFDLNIGLFAGTGNTDSDGPGKSRGDKKTFTNSTPISSSPNFDGGFTVGDFTYQTNQNVGRRNLQATTIENVGGNIGVTIEDGITTGVDCSTTVQPACANLIGEWSEINVDDGSEFGTPFRVTLLVHGSSVPGGTSADDIVLVHVLDPDGDNDPSNDVEIIGDTEDERCASADDSASARCVFVTKSGNLYTIVAWLFKNGNLRGGF
ncbi:MAG TPA: hypothetical protein VMQ65_07325 [Candidatus Limnocylindria bacterium]|nr:hypothetical protein [Candidatus Limnocylindria bacterium]